MDYGHFISCFTEDFPSFQITRNDLENPSQTFVRKYFSMMVQMVTRMPQLKHLSDAQLDMVKSTREGPYLTNMMGLSNLYKNVKYIMEKMGNQFEVRFSDILVPNLTPNRNFILMYAMYEFYSTCAEIDTCYEDLANDENNKTRMKKLKDEQSALKRQLDQKQEKICSFRERVTDIKRRLAEYSSENEDVQNMLKDLQVQEECEIKKFRDLEEQERKEHDQYTKIDTEKQYYETLVVSNEADMLEHYTKLQEKKDNATTSLQDLTKLSKDNQSILSIAEKILTLQEAINKELREDVAIGSRNYDLKSLHEITNSIQKEWDSTRKDEKQLNVQIKERKEAIADLKNTLARLQVDKDSVCCQWEQRLQKYRELQRDLEVSLSDWTGRVDITDVAMESKRQEIEGLSEAIEVSRTEVKRKHKAMADELALCEQAVVKELMELKKRAKSYINKH